MLGILTKLPLYRFYRKFGFPWLLPINFTISLTYRCNSRCKTCNVYTRKSEELSIDEYEKIFLSIGRSPYWVTFSGGEPFLKQCIADICIKVYEICKPKIINIPTNGILTERIEKEVRCILNACPDTTIIINLSIDAIGHKHDEIRGAKGSFERVMETYRRLKTIPNRNLTVGIHTVISKHNVKEIPYIYTQLKKLDPDSYITEIAEQRVELLTEKTDISPSLTDYSTAVDFITEDMKGWNMKGISNITRAFRTSYYKLVKDILREDRMFLPCYAGYASCQITPDGDVWACCIKAEVMGNLREADYDFKKVWFSEKARKVRKEIKERKCFCTLANTSYTNKLFSIKTLAGVAREVLTG
jgi:MoaA/NifB/PqqE/SkfB family radical SAM enzyme